MKHEPYELLRAAKFLMAHAEGEKSGQMMNIAGMLEWAADLIDLTGHGQTDYKERFEYEYAQLEERTRRLGHMLDNWDELSFTPSCTREMLLRQYEAMMEYRAIMEQRARIEEIPLMHGKFEPHTCG